MQIPEDTPPKKRWKRPFPIISRELCLHSAPSSGLDTVADKILKEDIEIVFNGGTHTDTVKMKYSDFEKLAGPKIADFGKHI